jgi:hypothetical protein
MIMNLLQKEATMTDDYKKLYNNLVLSGNYETSRGLSFPGITF